MPINEIVLTVSIIMQIKAGAVVGSASGFFYTKNEKNHSCLRIIGWIPEKMFLLWDIPFHFMIQPITYRYFEMQ